MNSNDKIYIAGHKGLVGSAICRQLKLRGFNNLITRSHNELDLVNQNEVQQFFDKEKPDYVVLAAAKVGGIYANSSYPAEFIYENLMIEANIIHSSYISNVERLLFLGSTCIYPRNVKQPMREDALLTDTLEPSNEPYAKQVASWMNNPADSESKNVTVNTNMMFSRQNNQINPERKTFIHKQGIIHLDTE